jgi:hypothetical protein
MEEGKQGDNGYDYYTCSSSSLERVFMEIVKISEQDDIILSTEIQEKSETHVFVLP